MSLTINGYLIRFLVHGWLCENVQEVLVSGIGELKRVCFTREKTGICPGIPVVLQDNFSPEEQPVLRRLPLPQTYNYDTFRGAMGWSSLSF